METIDFCFTGGMADLHEMNFYEAGRFNYGAARLIYTLERFRQDGTIVARLSTKVNADIRIRAPRPGSFWQQVLIHSAPVLADCALRMPFEVLFAHIWGFLLPPSRSQDVAVELATQEVSREKERTKQERERTKQLAMMTDVIKEGQATQQQTLDILKYAVENGRTLESDQVGHLSKQDVKALYDDALSAEKRAQLTNEYRGELAKIEPSKERRLAAQIRNPVRDMTLPLRSSADQLSIGNRTDANAYASLERTSVEFITTQKEDENSTLIRGKIKSYDVENGYGKFRFDELKRPVSFRVLSGARENVGIKVVDAMKKDDVLCSLFPIRDSYGNITSFILDDIKEDEALDQLGLTS